MSRFPGTFAVRSSGTGTVPQRTTESCSQRLKRASADAGTAAATIRSAAATRAMPLTAPIVHRQSVPRLIKSPPVFTKVLIANRGEIAIRVMRACEEMGIATVAVYSEIDRDAPHVRRADEAYLLGPAPASESYLVVDKIIEVCKDSGAEAVHPGYGFLAENANFARKLDEAGIKFIGPPADAIDAMGSKTRARELMKDAGVPIVPGTTDPVDTVEDARKIIDDSIGYPVAIKAAGGGGGKGFRVALDESELEKAFEGAAREGEKFFSDATVYIERYLPDPRHVE